MNKVAMYKEMIYKRAKDSTYISDFLAGLEPSGIYTFENALKNRENNNFHRHIGNLGGFVSGVTIGAATPAALAGAGYLALRKKNPAAAQALRDQMKASLSVRDPVNLAAGAIGGAVTALGVNAQYTAGQKMQKKLDSAIAEAREEGKALAKQEK